MDIQIKLIKYKIKQHEVDKLSNREGYELYVNLELVNKQASIPAYVKAARLELESTTDKINFTVSTLRGDTLADEEILRSLILRQLAVFTIKDDKPITEQLDVKLSVTKDQIKLVFENPMTNQKVASLDLAIEVWTISH